MGRPLRWSRKFLGLPAGERRLLVKAAFLLGAIRLGLKLFPFQTLRRVVDRLSETSERLSKDRTPTCDIAWAIDVVGRRMPGSCLTQALASQILLGRRGRPTRLHIGAFREVDGAFMAHAWLESDGEIVVGGHELERYTPLISLGKEST